MVYYFAYGSNLDYVRMFHRCESAEVVCRATLDGYRLVFMENNSKRIVANIIKEKGHHVDGVVYEITEKDLKRLDAFEGHPNVYKRKQVTISIKGEDKKVYVYIMPKTYDIKLGKRLIEIPRRYGMPKGDYFTHVQNGYNMFKLSQGKLLEAYKYSRDIAKKTK